jgi:hypothetical protein
LLDPSRKPEKSITAMPPVSTVLRAMLVEMDVVVEVGWRTEFMMVT